MIARLSEMLADALVGSGAAREEDRDIYVYGMDVLLSTAANIICILALGILIGRTLETLLFMSFFTVLRSAAGGFHANTHFKCFLIMLAAYALAMALSVLVPLDACRWVSLPIAAAAAATVAALAPVAHENRPVSAGELVKFRKLSLWIAALEVCAVALCVALSAGIPAFAASLGMLASAASLAAVYIAGLYKRGDAGKKQS